MVETLHLQELLHIASQGLLYPTIAILIALIVYAVCIVGSVVVEAASERRHYKVALPALLGSIESAPYAQLPQLIEQSGLLRSQKNALLTLVAYGYLPEEARVALAKRLLSEQEQRYLKVTSRTDVLAKIAPMIGLMGTLIPLGPGVVALGQGQTDLLSQSIMVAFDTTIAGLVVAIVALVVGRFRKRWYEDYLVAQESIMSAILEKASACIAAGERIGDEQSALAAVARLSAARPSGAAAGAPGAVPQPVPGAVPGASASAPVQAGDEGGAR